MIRQKEASLLPGPSGVCNHREFLTAGLATGVVRMKEECWHPTLSTSEVMGTLQAVLVTNSSLPGFHRSKSFSPAAKLL